MHLTIRVNSADAFHVIDGAGIRYWGEWISRDHARGRYAIREQDGQRVWTFGPEELALGIGRMLSGPAGECAARCLNGEADANDGDLWLQFVIFGEEKYA
jgi:hypothetical protein